MQTLEFVNLKCVTYAQPIPLPLINHQFVLMGLHFIVMVIFTLVFSNIGCEIMKTKRAQVQPVKSIKIKKPKSMIEHDTVDAIN